MKREELRNKLTDILSAAMSGGINLTQAERSIWDLFNSGLPPAEGAIKVQWSGYGELGNISQKPLQPTAEGAEEITAKKYLSDHGYGSGTNYSSGLVAALMTDFATLHAQRLAEKMVEEKMSELSNDPKFLFDICLSFRHDFGLLSAELQEGINFQAKEWLRAIQNNLKTRER